jgi:TrmH family RNA methyltransferase
MSSTATPIPRRITSRDNPLVKTLRQLAQDNTAYRRLGKLWLEGEHLCLAARARGVPVQQWVFSDAGWIERPAPLLALAEDIVVLPDALFDGLSDLPSPARMGCVLAVPSAPAIDPMAHTLVLDRVQDAGNVGSMLRSAAAFGASQILALKGTAALWSPKVLRSAMGAHFGLRLIEGLDSSDLQGLSVPLVATLPHQGPWLHELSATRGLPHPCAWILGHEGQGVQDALLAMAGLSVRIAQPGGEESLNVAAAAAICLYASATAH